MAFQADTGWIFLSLANLSVLSRFLKTSKLGKEQNDVYPKFLICSSSVQHWAREVDRKKEIFLKFLEYWFIDPCWHVEIIKMNKKCSLMNSLPYFLAIWSELDGRKLVFDGIWNNGKVEKSATLK